MKPSIQAESLAAAFCKVRNLDLSIEKALTELLLHAMEFERMECAGLVSGVHDKDEIKERGKY